MSNVRIVFLVLLILAFLAGAFWFAQDGARDTRALRTAVERANNLGKQWLFSNVLAEGSFAYSLNTEAGQYSRNNNAIRQLMASRVLAEAARGDAGLLILHQRNLTHIFEHWYREEGDFGYVYFDEKSKLGANAMLLRTLVASPLFETYIHEAEALADGILSLQHDDGSFSAWFKAPSYEYDEAYLLTFYSGEALLALVEYYERVRALKYLEAAQLSADFYVEHYAINLADNYYPAYVPWHTLALNKLYKIEPRESYAEAIFIMNDKLLELLDRTEHVGRFYNPETPQYGNPHSSSDAVYTEGLAYAYEIARFEGDEAREKRYLEALTLGTQHLIDLQYQTPQAHATSTPIYRYIGAIPIRHDSPWIRVDTTQHAVDAFTKILEILPTS